MWVVTGIRYWKEILIVMIVFLSLPFFLLFFFFGTTQQPDIVGPGGNAKVSTSVLQYEPLLRQYAAQFGISDYVPLMMALMQQESSGQGLDPMQASESGFNTKYCHIPGCISDPNYSVYVGVQAFKETITKSKGDIDLALQSYNFGSGFIDFVTNNGGHYTKDLAQAFSILQATKLNWPKYGDVDYVDHVLRYYEAPTTTVNLPEGTFKNVMNIALKYQGMPYFWSGNNPATSFDCSGLWEFSFKQIGIYFPRTAEDQYNFTQRITKDQLQPGDFVFFAGTYNGPYITHVGMYVGNNYMYDADNAGIGYHELGVYWQSHVAGYGRLK